MIKNNKIYVKIKIGDDMNNKGFTLIELIGSMVILGLLMVLVVPNVVGLLNNSRETVYVEDAKKLINIAKAKMSSKKVVSPSNDACIFLGLGFLENGEFDNPPNGGCYDVNRSYVVVKKNSSTKEYEYYVQLVEYFHKKHNGLLHPVQSTALDKDVVEQGVDANSSTSTVAAYNYLGSTGVELSGVCNNYSYIYLKNGPKTYVDKSIGICAK